MWHYSSGFGHKVSGLLLTAATMLQLLQLTFLEQAIYISTRWWIKLRHTSWLPSVAVTDDDDDRLVAYQPTLFRPPSRLDNQLGLRHAGQAYFISTIVANADKTQGQQPVNHRFVDSLASITWHTLLSGPLQSTWSRRCIGNQFRYYLDLLTSRIFSRKCLQVWHKRT